MDAKAEKRFRAVTRHESGHYVIGERLGFAMQSLSIEPGGNAASEGGFIRQAATPEDIKQLIEDRVTVLYAGCVAESLEAGTIREDYCINCLKTTAQQDWAKIKELLYILQGMRTPIADEKKLAEAVMTLSNELGDRCAKLVIQEAAVIDAVAHHLFMRVAAARGKVIVRRSEVEAIAAFKERFRP